jgi:hypothetical protein
MKGCVQRLYREETPDRTGEEYGRREPPGSVSLSALGRQHAKSVAESLASARGARQTKAETEGADDPRPRVGTRAFGCLVQTGAGLLPGTTRNKDRENRKLEWCNRARPGWRVNYATG